jgi:tetrahydromethanopterin S-methyltransferase subunit C
MIPSWIIYVFMIFNSMNKNLEKTILEMFGEPIGKVPGITTVGAAGVRNMSEDDLGDVCPSCGMMSVDGQCACLMRDVCPMCGMMPPAIDRSCGCAMTEAKKEAKRPKQKKQQKRS